MVYATQSVKVTIGHIIIGTDEIAETGFHISDPGGFSASGFMSAGASVGGSIGTAWIAFLGSSGVVCPNWSRFSYVKMAPVGLDGRYLGEPTINNYSTVGTGIARQLPQESIVVGLSSRQSLGEANRGRMYLPHISTALVSNSYRSSANGSVSLAAKTFLQAVNTAAGSVTGFTNSRVCIMSSKGLGTTKRVMDIRVGDIIDTQRRRRNRLAETYSTNIVIV